MGLFSKIKKQLLSVIEYKNDDRKQIVWRYPLTDREEIMTSSTLIVRESQAAIFVHKGKVADVFLSGTYKLSTDNIPFLTKLLSLPTGFESPIKAEVYFVNLNVFAGNKWGTQNPVIIRDADYGSVRIRGYGTYNFKVEDPKIFLTQMFGTSSSFSVEDVEQHTKSLIVSRISDAIGESKISILDLASNYFEIAEKTRELSSESFAKFGLKLCEVIIENLSLPDEVQQAIDERSKLGILEDKVGTYTRLKAADAMEEAAKNPSGNNLAGLGMGLSAGVQMGGVFNANLSGENPSPLQSNTTTCSNCGANIKKNAKFCPDCGAKQGLNCPNCGHEVKKTSKFCPECGTKLKEEKVCECGAKLNSKSKFCPDCGKEVKE